MTMIRARRTAVFSARTMSARSSPTTDLKRTSMPSVANSSVMHKRIAVRPAAQEQLRADSYFSMVCWRYVLDWICVRRIFNGLRKRGPL